MRQVKFIIYQLLLSVAYIHSKQIIHRDIKPVRNMQVDVVYIRACRLMYSLKDATIHTLN